MAEKKQHTYVAAGTGEKKAPAAKPAAKPEAPAKQSAPAAPAKGNPKTKRLLAWVLWILAIGMEALAFFIFTGKLEITFMSQMAAMIIALAIDFALVVVGAQFWKQANHMDPVSEANKLKFWLWNNMGVIVCCFAFIPFIILALTNKDADPKLKKVAVIAAAAALLIGGAASYDYNPVSQEGVAQAAETLSGTTVYWTQYGTKYHTHDDCQHLNRTDELMYGSVEDAVEAGRTSLCKTCAKLDNLELGDNGAVLGDAPVQAAAEAVEEAAEAAAEAPAA